jgi:hypothetical protein
MQTIKITPEADISGTSLQGGIDTTYKMLCKMFGIPEDGDGYKTDAEWVLTTPFGVGTIYNYKDGKAYLGDEGLDTEDITDWHIGGHNNETAIIIQTAIECYEAGYNCNHNI